MNNKVRRNVGIILFFIAPILCTIPLSGIFISQLRNIGDLIIDIAMYVISISVFTFIFMLIPLIFRIASNERLSYKKGNIVCIINSILMAVLASAPFVLYIIKTPNPSVYPINEVETTKELVCTFIIAGILYYFINTFLFANSRGEK